MKTRHRRHANPFNFRQSLTPVNLDEIFKRKAPVEVEIGFGKGQFLLTLAKQRPDFNYVGLEIRPFLVEQVQARAKILELSNVHTIHCNANTALNQLFKEQSIARFYVNFPDPWFKKRHTKRRVINLDTARMIKSLLAPGGEIHVMTDYEPIAIDMLQSLEQAGFRNLKEPGRMADTSTTGISSEREDWHMSQKDPIYRFSLARE